MLQSERIYLFLVGSSSLIARQVAQRNKFILVSLSILVVAAFFANIYLVRQTETWAWEHFLTITQAVRVAQMIGVVPQGQDV